MWETEREQESEKHLLMLLFMVCHACCFSFFFALLHSLKKRKKKQRKCREIYYFKGVFPSLFIYKILNASVRVRVCVCVYSWMFDDFVEIPCNHWKKSWFFCILLNLRSTCCYWLAGWLVCLLFSKIFRLLRVCVFVCVCVYESIYFS